MTNYRKSKPKVFFDASVIFSAIYSSRGASFQLSILTKEEKIIGVTSQTVIDEVLDNVDKFKKTPDLYPSYSGLQPEGAAKRIRGVYAGTNLSCFSINVFDFISNYNFLVREAITTDEIKPFAGTVEEKDAHILAGAILTKCNYLVTLDKKHLDNRKVKAKVSQIKIISPGELFLKLHLKS